MSHLSMKAVFATHMCPLLNPLARAGMFEQLTAGRITEDEDMRQIRCSGWDKRGVWGEIQDT